MKFSPSYRSFLDTKLEEFKKLCLPAPGWKQIVKSTDLSIFLALDKKNIAMLKSEGIIKNCDLNELETLLWDDKTNWLKIDDSLQEFKILHDWENSTVRIAYNFFKTTTFVSHRDMVLLIEKKREGNNKFYIYGSSVEIPELPEVKNVVRAKSLVWGWEIEELPDKTLKCTGINYADLGGSLPNFVIKKVLEKEYGYLIRRTTKYFASKKDELKPKL